MPKEKFFTTEHNAEIPGLKRRHVDNIRIIWDDQPPLFIRDARMDDIMKALRLGFKQMDRILDAREARLRESLSTSQED